MYEKPLVIARTGDVENAPENTLPAFESAISRGADGVECDVHLSADGELVVHHFYNLGTTDNGEGLVCEHTLAELKALDSGGWFSEQCAGESKPTLSEVFGLCKDRTRLEVDLKDSSAAFLHKVVREVQRYDLGGDVELTTAHYPLLGQVKKLNPELRTGTFFYEPPDWMPVRLAQRHTLDWAGLLGIAVVHLNIALITTDFVDELHRRGFGVHGSNLDSTEQIQRGLDLGVDSFSTGHLGMALRLRDEFMSRSILGHGRTPVTETSVDRLSRFYGAYDEETRLSRDNMHRVEFITAVHVLDRQIAEKSKILDVAAGVGKYAFYYASRGHQVWAQDIVAIHVDRMRQIAQETGLANVDVARGDARNLSRFQDCVFDVVLCMGPIYHMADEQQRIGCLRENLRVLKPGGLLAVTYLNRPVEKDPIAECHGLAGRKQVGYDWRVLDQGSQVRPVSMGLCPSGGPDRS
jgi:glycerophosphoryl diester phosphodiesterase/2-polyprenyl-3-methyl-5-hydroxy-6-metoxy-1,4-benzoquinol methylase